MHSETIDLSNDADMEIPQFDVNVSVQDPFAHSPLQLLTYLLIKSTILTGSRNNKH